MARVEIQSRMICDDIYHPDGGYAALRHAILWSMSQTDCYDTLHWPYGGFGWRDAAQAVL
jgi:hypothetical protein